MEHHQASDDSEEGARRPWTQRFVATGLRCLCITMMMTMTMMMVFYPADVFSSNFDSLKAHRQVVNVIGQQRFQMQVFADLTDVTRYITQVADSIQCGNTTH